MEEVGITLEELNTAEVQIKPQREQRCTPQRDGEGEFMPGVITYLNVNGKVDRLWEMESKKLMEELGVTVEDFDPKPTDAESKNKAIKAMLSTIHKKEKEALIRQGILTSIKRTWSLR